MLKERQQAADEASDLTGALPLFSFPTFQDMTRVGWTCEMEVRMVPNLEMDTQEGNRQAYWIHFGSLQEEALALFGFKHKCRC